MQQKLTNLNNSFLNLLPKEKQMGYRAPNNSPKAAARRAMRRRK